jgi:hypothetical protein
MRQDTRLEHVLLTFRAVQVLPLNDRQEPIRVTGGIRTASGFLRREAEGLFLYTCWHVVTGGIEMDPPKVPPLWTRPVALRVRMVRSEPYRGGWKIGGLAEVDVPLLRETDQPTPLWVQDQEEVDHPDINHAGYRVPRRHDIVKIPLHHSVHTEEAEVDYSRVSSLIVPGEKVLILGFPYGYSAFDREGPTPVMLTRFVAAARGADNPQLLLDGACAQGMSGGPVFRETESGNLKLIAIYTGAIFPDKRGYAATALGKCTNLFWWDGHRL